MKNSISFFKQIIQSNIILRIISFFKYNFYQILRFIDQCFKSLEFSQEFDLEQLFFLRQQSQNIETSFKDQSSINKFLNNLCQNLEGKQLIIGSLSKIINYCLIQIDKKESDIYVEISLLMICIIQEQIFKRKDLQQFDLFRSLINEKSQTIIDIYENSNTRLQTMILYFIANFSQTLKIEYDIISKILETYQSCNDVGHQLHLNHVLEQLVKIIQFDQEELLILIECSIKTGNSEIFEIIFIVREKYQKFFAQNQSYLFEKIFQMPVSLNFVIQKFQILKEILKISDNQIEDIIEFLDQNLSQFENNWEYLESNLKFLFKKGYKRLIQDFIDTIFQIQGLKFLIENYFKLCCKFVVCDQSLIQNWDNDLIDCLQNFDNDIKIKSNIILQLIIQSQKIILNEQQIQKLIILSQQEENIFITIQLIYIHQTQDDFISDFLIQQKFECSLKKYNNKIQIKCLIQIIINSFQVKTRQNMIIKLKEFLDESVLKQIGQKLSDISLDYDVSSKFLQKNIKSIPNVYDNFKELEYLKQNLCFMKESMTEEQKEYFFKFIKTQQLEDGQYRYKLKIKS